VRNNLLAFVPGAVRVFASCIFLVGLAGCFGPQVYLGQRRVILDTVYFNDSGGHPDRGEFTLWIPTDRGEIEIVSLVQGRCGVVDRSGSPKRPTIVRDVQVSEKPWALLYRCDPGGGGPVEEQLAELHLRQNSKVTGGAWDHGKLGKGTVSTVE
jgi:hypothetical protein